MSGRIRSFASLGPNPNPVDFLSPDTSKSSILDVPRYVGTHKTNLLNPLPLPHVPSDASPQLKAEREPRGRSNDDWRQRQLESELTSLRAVHQRVQLDKVLAISS